MTIPICYTNIVSCIMEFAPWRWLRDPYAHNVELKRLNKQKYTLYRSVLSGKFRFVKGIKGKRKERFLCALFLLFFFARMG
jgi:hypothetical protein